VTGPIICGVDDSPATRGAIRVARSFGTELGLRVVFVHVMDVRAPEEEATAIAARLERLSSGVSESGCSSSWCVDAGHPADGLVTAAQRVGASMIVVGSGGPRSSLLGSVSADVSRRAPCPVVVVPPGAEGGPSGRRNGDEHTAAAEPGSDRPRLVAGDARGEFGGWIARFTAG
jgi:nucleotide-binding universal stress UspA family protein